MSQLKSIQALRAIAALSVMLAHLYGVESNHSDGAPLLPRFAVSGLGGVDLFFVISGFIIVWVAGDLAPGVKSSASFLYARVTRIYPTWWLFAGALALYYYVTLGVPWDPALLEPRGVSGAEHFLKSAFLIPHAAPPVLELGWTLVHEMCFYVIFAVLLFFPRGWRYALLGLWGVALVAAVILGTTSFHASSVTTLFLHTMNLEFLMGALVGWAVKSGRTQYAAPVLGLGIVAMIYAIIFVDVTLNEPTTPLYRTIFYGGASAMIVYGVAALEIKSRQSAWAHERLVQIGDWSYSLYLSHLLIIGALAEGFFPQFGQGTLASLGFIVLGSASAIAVAGLSYHLFERPTIRLFRRWGPKSNYRTAKPAPAPAD